MSRSRDNKNRAENWQEPIIVADGLSKEYPMGEEVVCALRQASFEVHVGAFVALMGPSGSGKSTLMHLLGCLDTPTAGHYFLHGRDVTHLSQQARAEVRNRHIGFVFQSFNLLSRLSTLENVMLPLQYRRTHRDGRHNERVLAQVALSQVGLESRANHKPTELSGGQRQRVAIARALVTDPALILADEPTGNLDSSTGAEILNLLVTLNDNGRTIILVTHDAQVANNAQTILTMHDGRIVDGLPHLNKSNRDK